MRAGTKASLEQHGFVQPDTGKVSLTMKCDAIRRAAVEGRVIVNCPAMPVGDYAVMVFHDISGSGRLESDWFGRPAQPWGA